MIGQGDGNIAVDKQDNDNIFPESYANNWDKGKGTRDVGVYEKINWEIMVNNIMMSNWTQNQDQSQLFPFLRNN